MKKNLLTVIALIALTLGFTSCSKNNVSGTSYIQITNASETSSPFDFYIDNSKVNSNTLQYNQSTGYVSVASGDHSAVIKIASSGVNAEAFDIQPQPGIYYSVYYFGNTTLAYVDAIATPATGKARVRFINLNEELTDKIDFGVAGGAKIVTGLVNLADSEYFDVNAGTTFSAYITGTTTELLNIPTTIEAGHVYTIYLSGETKGGLKATVLLQK